MIAALQGATDMRLVRILKGLDNRVGAKTRKLREKILAEMGARVARAYCAERRRMRAALREKQDPIRTWHAYPPIPVRSSDWAAYRDSEVENVNRYGWGATEAEAIADLMELESDE